MPFFHPLDGAGYRFRFKLPTMLTGLLLLSGLCSADAEAPPYDLRISGEGVERPLTLNQALAYALRSNLDIQIESISPQVEADRVQQAEGEFDPAIEARFRYDTLDTPQTSQEFVSTGGNRFLGGLLISQTRVFAEDNFEAKTGIVGKLRNGAQYDIGVRGNRYINDLTRDATVAQFNPEYRTFTGLTFVQPLMQNYGNVVNESQITVGRRDKEIADLVFRQKLSATVKNVIAAYYDAFLAFEDAKVKRFEMDVLRRMVDEKSDQLERGATTEREVALVRSTLSESYERFLLARQTLLERNGELLLHLQQDFDFDAFPVYLPVDAPSGLRPTLDPGLLVRESIRCRPEYLMAVETVEKLGIVLQYRENQLMPRIDIEGTIGYTGLQGSFGGAFSENFQGQGHEYGVGIVVSMPLGNTEKKALYAETEHQKRQALLKVKQEEFKAHVLINQHVTAVQTHERRLLAARHSTRLQMENLETARESLEKGTISESMVLKVERDVSETTLRQYAAAADLQKSLADLWEANGTILARYRIGVSEATHLEPAQITSRGVPVQKNEYIVESADYGLPEDRRGHGEGGGRKTSAFKQLFVRTEKAGSKVSEGNTVNQVTLVASPVPLVDSDTSAKVDETSDVDDVVEPVLIASPVKQKGLKSLFEKR